MNKKEFLDILNEQLSGQMPEGTVSSHIQYYRNYIEEQRRTGRSEDDILSELGDPRLIARTLLDTESVGSSRSYSPYTEADDHYEQASQLPPGSFHLVWESCSDPHCCCSTVPFVYSSQHSDSHHAHCRSCHLSNPSLHK